MGMYEISFWAVCSSENQKLISYISQSHLKNSWTLVGPRMDNAVILNLLLHIDPDLARQRHVAYLNRERGYKVVQLQYVHQHLPLSCRAYMTDLVYPWQGMTLIPPASFDHEIR